MPRIIVQPPYVRQVLDVCVAQDYFSIGRMQENDLTVIDECVSRFHATIFYHQGDLYIIDHSKNGTYYSSAELALPVPKWSGFVESKLDNFDEYEQFVKLIVNSDKVHMLASEGRKLQHEGRIIIPKITGSPLEMLFVDPNGV